MRVDVVTQTSAIMCNQRSDINCQSLCPHANKKMLKLASPENHRRCFAGRVAWASRDGVVVVVIVIVIVVVVSVVVSVVASVDVFSCGHATL